MAGARTRRPGTFDFDQVPAELRSRLSQTYNPQQKGRSWLFRATLDSDQPVMVKVAPEQKGMDTVRLLWRQADPQHVVRLLYTGTADSLSYEVTEYLPQCSVQDRMRTQPTVDAAEARRFLDQMAAALHHVHELPKHARDVDGIVMLVHRDIKPANILIRSGPDEPLDVCVADFGSASAQRQERELATEAITSLYAAPEMLRRGYVSHPVVDWWSLGMTLLEWLEGEHPYQRYTRDPSSPRTSAGSATDLIADWLTGTIVPIGPSVPDELRRPLEGLLSHNYEARWQYPQITQWQLGGTPRVVRSIGTSQRPMTTFSFGDLVVSKPAELAAKMATNWPFAAALVIGRHWQDLLYWVRSFDPPLAARLETVGGTADEDRRPVDLLVTEAIVQLDPTAAPTFRGHPVTRPDLAKLARDAFAGAEEAVQRAKSLRSSGALRVLANLSGAEHLREADATWNSWYDRACQAATEKLGSVDELAAPGQLDGMLLMATVEPAYTAKLARQARDRATPRTRRVGWFARLEQQAVGPDAPAYHAVMVLAAGIALDWGRRPGPARHQAQRLARQFAGDIATEAKRSTRRGRAAAAKASPLNRRLRARGRVTAAGVAGLIGCVALATVAGAGVALSTSLAEGALTAAMLLVATVWLLLGLTLRWRRTGNVLLGGWTGTVLGLGLALLTGWAGHTIRGPVLGWPLFWGVWVATAMVGAAMGATE